MTENSKEINKPLTSKNDFGEVSMLPNKWWFLCTSILSLVLYYFDMITDYIMLNKFFYKINSIKSNLTNMRLHYLFLFESVIHNFAHFESNTFQCFKNKLERIKLASSDFYDSTNFCRKFFQYWFN